MAKGGRRLWALAVPALLGGLLVGAGFAQNATPPERIEEVRVVGNRRIPESTIAYHIQTKENDPYNEQQILRDYRNLLNTSFFSEAKALLQQGETGIIVIFEVVERPLIRAIEYEGMKSFKESDVLERFRDMRVNLTVDSPFDESRLPQARKALRALLEGNGRPLGRVGVKVEPITSSAVKIVFQIDEGPKVRIGDISFEGNTVFSDGDLRDALDLNKERGLFTIFKGTDKYIPDKLEFDVQTNLLEKYREHGYIFARAGEPEVKIVEGPRGFLLGFRKTKQQYYVSVPIQEGEQYKVNSFSVDGVETFDGERVRSVFPIKEGEVVNYTLLKESSESLKQMYTQFGYLDMDTRPEITPDQNAKTVDIQLHVSEGKRYSVDRITFAGNTKTRDKVLRREFALEEQMPFNSRLLDISILRLNQLGFFENIEEQDYEVIKKPQESSVDVVVKVKEKSQQSIGFTGGVSGISGSFFGINYSANNFRGTGDSISVALQTGTRSQTYSFSYTKPYFMDTPMSLGFSVFRTGLDFDTFIATGGLISPDDSLTLFDQTSTGFNVSASYPLSRWSRVGLRYGFSSIRIGDIAEGFEDAALSQLVFFTPGGDLEDARKGIIRSEITPSWVYNTKNSFFTATDGEQLSVQLPISGGPLGGNLNIIRPTVEYQRFMPDRWLSGGRNTLAFRAQLQHVRSFGTTSTGLPQTPPFFERIFAGGEFDVRGFDVRSMSPLAFTRTPRRDSVGNPLLDPVTGLPLVSEQLVPVGGDTLLVFTGEYRMHVVGPLQLNGFFDIGTSTVLNQSDLRISGTETAVQLIDSTNNVWRASTGTEVQFLMPVINQPVRLIFAYNPLRLSTDLVIAGVKRTIKEDSSNMKFTVGYNF